jgi:NADPH-dependent F420 reductase
MRLALAGERILLGSRDATRAAQIAQQLRDSLGKPDAQIAGLTNAEAAHGSDIAFVCLPIAALATTLPEVAPLLRGKIVIELVNPIERNEEGFRLLPLPAPSAGEYVAQLLPGAEVASAFKTLGARQLLDVARPLVGDVLMCADSSPAKKTVADFVGRMPNLRAVDAGPLRNVRYLEATTALLLEINRLHKATTSLQIVGLDSLSLD